MPIIRDPKDPEIRQIDLKHYGVHVGDISFLRVEWWDDSSRFVVVRFAYKGEEAKKDGFRLDLDKRVFLDHFLRDQELDKEVQKMANPIWGIVVKERSMADRVTRFSIP
jgi:hypothetical protein